MISNVYMSVNENSKDCRLAFFCFISNQCVKPGIRYLYLQQVMIFGTTSQYPVPATNCYTVSQKRIPDIIDRNMKKDYQISVICEYS